MRDNACFCLIILINNRGLGNGCTFTEIYVKYYSKESWPDKMMYSIA